MSRARAIALVALATLTACGDSAPDRTAASTRPWRGAVVAGPSRAGGIAFVGPDVLFVDRERVDRWHVLSRAHLADGATATARPLEPTVDRTALVGGRGPLAARGLAMSVFIDLPAEIVGLGVGENGYLQIVDRRMRVLWWARALGGAGGGVAAVTLDRATVLPGGDHRGLREADPRDHGPGLRAAAGVGGTAEAFDLAVVEASPEDGVRWRLQRLDRTGATVKRPRELGRVGTLGDIVAIAFDGRRYLALLGGTHLASFPAGDGTPIELADIEALPAPGGWERIAVAADGTILLAQTTEAGIRVALR